MKSFNEALSLILNEIAPLEAISVETFSATGFVLAEDIVTPIPLPPFDNSAVDGFAVCTDDLSSMMALPMDELIAAGDSPIILRKGAASRIMTGAILPRGANAIVMQEKVKLMDEVAYFSAPVSVGENIRRAGEDIPAGETIFKRGRTISPKDVGLLCALGFASVRVYRKPTVAILSTGSELVSPGIPLSPGQVYYCTGPMLAAACTEFGAHVQRLERVHDDEDATTQAVHSCLGYDLLLVTGGMSVGEHDYARCSFTKLGVREIFYRGKWRPGKPLFFGDWEQGARTIVFGIPGNPVACFVMASLFLRAAIAKMSGREDFLPWKIGHLAADFSKKKGFSLFARGLVDEEGAIQLFESQGSHELGKLSKANAICLLHEDWDACRAGEIVQYLPA